MVHALTKILQQAYCLPAPPVCNHMVAVCSYESAHGQSSVSENHLSTETFREFEGLMVVLERVWMESGGGRYKLTVHNKLRPSGQEFNLLKRLSGGVVGLSPTGSCRKLTVSVSRSCLAHIPSHSLCFWGCCIISEPHGTV